MPDLGDIPILARGAIPGAAGGGAPDAVPCGLVWLEDGEERPFLDADAPRPWLEASSENADAPTEHLRPHQDEEPPALLWI